MQKKKQMLTDLEIDKVAFVPVGDNIGADIALYKAKPTGAEGAPPESATPKEGTTKKVSLKSLVSAFFKALGFTDEDVENGETPGEPEGVAVEGGGTEPPASAADEGTADPTPSGDDAAESTKGVDDEMKIDKSKFTPEELASYEALVAKAAVQDDPTPSAETDPVDKSAAETTPAQTEAGEADIYKGLHPAVAAELADLRKRADAAEMRELTEIAKKYEVLGKKPEELAATLKGLKDAGGTAYTDMIALLDSSLQAVEKSGAFREVGKSGRGSEAATDAWSQIEKHASEIQKAAPNMTLAQAIEKACEQHPDLVAEYENNR